MKWFLIDLKKNKNKNQFKKSFIEWFKKKTNSIKKIIFLIFIYLISLRKYDHDKSIDSNDDGRLTV